MNNMYKVKNNDELPKRIKLTKRAGAALLVKGNSPVTFVEEDDAVYFCLAGNEDLLVDQDGNLLTDGDDINLSI